MKKVIEELFKLQDLDYRNFQSKLMPTIDINTIIGVRIPYLRTMAKEMVKNNEYQEFIKELPHKYYDENNLHGYIISELKDYEETIKEINNFLPFIDNWATCDTTSPKIFKKNKDKLIIEIEKWISSNETYTIRFGIEMMMSHYLDNNFKLEYLDLISNIKSEEYYVNMMISWFFQTALTKQWNYTIKIIENKKLSKWVHNKTIQKSLESNRINKEQKEYLKGLKIIDKKI